MVLAPVQVRCARASVPRPAHPLRRYRPIVDKALGAKTGLWVGEGATAYGQGSVRTNVQWSQSFSYIYNNLNILKQGGPCCNPAVGFLARAPFAHIMCLAVRTQSGLCSFKVAVRY